MWINDDFNYISRRGYESSGTASVVVSLVELGTGCQCQRGADSI